METGGKEQGSSKAIRHEEGKMMKRAIVVATGLMLLARGVQQQQDHHVSRNDRRSRERKGRGLQLVDGRR